MKKNRSNIILILIFLVGLSVMLYPTVSDYINQKNQSRAVASYSEEVENLSDVDYQAYFDAADDYNRRLAETPDAFYRPEEVSGYTDTLDVSGTGIMGYITIPKIGVELPSTTAPATAFCRWRRAIWRAAAFRWAAQAPTPSSRPTVGCPAPSSLPIWMSWKWATPSPSRCWTGC